MAGVQIQLESADWWRSSSPFPPTDDPERRRVPQDAVQVQVHGGLRGEALRGEGGEERVVLFHDRLLPALLSSRVWDLGGSGRHGCVNQCRPEPLEEGISLTSVWFCQRPLTGQQEAIS